MTYILVILTIIAAGTSGGAPGSIGHHVYKDWRPIGEFKNAEACKHAAALIGKDGNSAKCLPTDTKKPVSGVPLKGE